jgi:hypothetical protein
MSIFEGGNVLAANGTAVYETCNNTNIGTNCAMEASDVVRGIVEHDCSIPSDVTSFAHALDVSRFDYDAIATFACEMGDCYPALASCRDDMTTCAESLSCDCANVFLSAVANLSSGFSVMSNGTELGAIRAAACCDDYNREAANLMNLEYCAFQESFVRMGSIFASSSDDVDAIKSSCSDRHACAGNVTEKLARMNAMGCDIRQKSDDAAKFLFYLNNSTDVGAIMNFVCDVSHECYDAAVAVVDTCSRDTIDAGGCTKAAPEDCFRSFIAMVDGISDEGRDVLLGFDSSIMDKISNAPRSWYHSSANIFVCLSVIFHMLSYIC